MLGTCDQCRELGDTRRRRVFYDPRVGVSLCADCAGVEDESDDGPPVVDEHYDERQALDELLGYDQ